MSARSEAVGSLSNEHVQDALLRERYRQWAPSYDGAFASYSERTLQEAVEALGTPLPRHILDLGCGTGLLVQRLTRSDPAVHVTGVDFSEDMLQKSRSHLSEQGCVRFIHGRADQIPAASRSFDAVVVANAFHLIRHGPAALSECRRVLRPGGSLVIVDWCRDFVPMRLFAWGLLLTQRLRRRIISMDAQQRMLANAGFRVTDARRFRARPVWGLMRVTARLES